MGQAIAQVLTYGVGVAISPVPIIAVILMLFSTRAKVNGPAFTAGWAIALAVVCGVAYAVSDQTNASTDSGTSDAISWGKIVFGLLFLLLAVRQWKARPASGAEAPLPKWMAGIEAFSPGKSFALALLLGGVNPKNLLLAAGAGASLAQSGVSTADAIVAIVVFVVVGSLTIAGPVLYYLVGGEHARSALDDLKAWLTVHNAAVMTVLFLVLGADLIAKGLAPLWS